MNGPSNKSKQMPVRDSNKHRAAPKKALNMKNINKHCKGNSWN